MLTQEQKRKLIELAILWAEKHTRHGLAFHAYRDFIDEHGKENLALLGDMQIALSHRSSAEEAFRDYVEHMHDEPEKVQMDQGGRYDIQSGEPGWYVKQKIAKEAAEAAEITQQIKERNLKPKCICGDGVFHSYECVSQE